MPYNISLEMPYKEKYIILQRNNNVISANSGPKPKTTHYLSTATWKTKLIDFLLNTIT